MKRFVPALIRSTITHLLLAAGLVLGIGLGGNWIEQRFRLGSAHPSAVVEMRWSGPSGTDAAPKKPRKRARTAIATSQPDGVLASPPADASGTQGDQLMPAGTLVAAHGAPEYPPLSRRSGEEGTVTLEFMLEEGGKAEGIAIARSSGFVRLDNAALDFLKSTRLQVPPGTLPDRRLQVSFVFKLQD
jgi:TonB family protein